MAKEIEYKIEEVICTLTDVPENEEIGWAKTLLKMKWGDNPITMDIRNMNIAKSKFGKGISLKDEEVDTMVQVLVEKGYGDLDELEKAIHTRKKKYMIIEDEHETIQLDKLNIKLGR